MSLRHGLLYRYLDQERLRRYADRADYHRLLRLILSFFLKLQPKGLLETLDEEPRREQRHLLLALLEVHGGPAREEAWTKLQASLQDGARVNPFTQRNLLYLLRIIPRPETASVEEEVDAAIRTSGRSSPPRLVKQVMAFLAHCRHDKAERVLIGYLKVYENRCCSPKRPAIRRRR